MDDERLVRSRECSSNTRRIRLIGIGAGLFLDDANKAVVWFIRFRALTGWCEREGMAAWLRSDPARAQHANELAASFQLPDDCQFDSERFRSAVASVGRHK